MDLSAELDVDALVEESFKKIFSYVNQSDPNIPWTLYAAENVADKCLQERKALVELKHSLNTVKSSLNDFDIVEWSNHTNLTNVGAKILPHLRKTIHPELATQAWCKFYELLSYGNVVPEDCQNVFCSVHLCEAPGGFICALNHYVKTKYPRNCQHLWVGNTLNPYYEGNTLDSCIVDDRLISRTIRSWCFGKDNTGNILSKDYISSLQRHCSRTFKGKAVNLVTADGSLNCQDDPSEQETIVSPLHYTELLCALSVLSTGGTFIVKMFTLFEVHSVNFMYALCCLFKSVTVLKPATSKAGNSEVYVIARDFCGQENCTSFIDSLAKHLPFYDFIKTGVNLSPNIPKSFLIQHINCVKCFTNYQITTIQRNRAWYRKVTAEFKSTMKKLQEMVTQRFFDECELKKVHPKQCIVPSGVLRYHVRSNIKLRPRLEGSYTQRVLNDSDMDIQVPENEDCASWTIEPKWLHCLIKQFWWNTTQAVLGKVIENIHSSLFCDTGIIVQYEHAFEQITQKNSDISYDDPDKSISNVTLFEELSRMLSCQNGTCMEVEIEGRDPFHTNWFRNLMKTANGTLASSHIALSEYNRKPLPHKVEIVYGNFVLSCLDQLKWPELKIRFDLVKSVLLVVNSLEKNGMCTFILPSVLTRLSGEVLWVFSQCFEESVILPVKSCGAHSHPAVLFVGKKYKHIPGYVHSLLHSCNLASTRDRDLLELFPITALLHTDKALSFIESLRKANEKCLSEATMIINNKVCH